MSRDRPTRKDRLLVGLVLLGAAGWVVTWVLIGQTAEGTKEVSGLSEGNLRAFQNPGTLLMLLALRGWWRRGGSRLGEVGAGGLIVTALALVIVLVGNLVEFGIWGEGPFSSQDPGAAIFFTGLFLLPLGLALLASAIACAAWRRARRSRS